MRGGGFEVVGIKNMMNRLDKSVLKVDALCKSAVSKACLMVERETKKSMQGSRTEHTGFGGRQYKVPGTKKWYTASQPGEPPAIVTGRLFNSITWNIENKEKAK